MKYNFQTCSTHLTVSVLCFFMACQLSIVGEGIQQTPAPVAPSIAEASSEGRIALEQFRVPAGWEKQLFVAEPDVANIVAFTIDNRGRFYVCETFRQEQGVTDNRSHDQNWLEHDLAAQTVQDRIDYHRKLLPDADSVYTRQDDRIRLVEDTDGDGVADSSKVFANRFNRLEDGTGAGVLNVGDSVWYTNIPDLWRLRDSDGDGVADERESLQTGFGVRVAFRGHDMHGLVMGPDGRVYFSIGDRGYHLELPDGRVLADPNSGAVFRCEPDGSGLEVFATGLRNPQELAFDQFGNLFTGDNNSDSGDRARWVYVMHGSDSGWRMHYQYLPDRGPFNREKIWHPYHREQPAYIVPPVANLGDGPSGLIYYPGTGIGEGLTDCFLMCDFRGTGVTSGIRAFKSVPDGAFFKLEEQPAPVWQILATDLAVGPDGWLYISDWVDGWVGEGKGRIYRFGDPAVINGQAARETARLLAEGMSGREIDELVMLLGHADMRIRQGAQFELVNRNAIDELSAVAIDGPNLQSRIHGVWGAGQYYRQRNVIADEAWMRKLLYDDELEVRAAMARVAGDISAQSVAEDLVKLLADHSARVRAMSSISLGQLKYHPACEGLIRVLEENNDEDPALRHAAVMGLTGCFNDAAIETALENVGAVSVARGLVVVLRRLHDERLTRLYMPKFGSSVPLHDCKLIQSEVARAVYDTRIGETYLTLPVFGNGSSVVNSRAIQAKRRLNEPDTLAKIAADKQYPDADQIEALQVLRNWEVPQKLDPLLGRWDPLPALDRSEAVAALDEVADKLLANSNEEILSEAFDTFAVLGVTSASTAMEAIAVDPQRSPNLRASAIRSLMVGKSKGLDVIAKRLANDPSPDVRSVVLETMVRSGSDLAVGTMKKALESRDLPERQRAIRLLPELENRAAVQIVDEMVSAFLSGNMPPELRLDFLATLQKLGVRNEGLRMIVASYEANRDVNPDPTARWKDSLVGGDFAAGKKLFYEKTALSCLRCHHVGADGGNVGPNLSDVGLRRDRQYLLESIVLPNKEITEKFGSVVILTDSGETVTGIVHSETRDFVRLVRADGDMVTVDTAEIVDRRTGKSAMPEDVVQHLTPHEMRDLIEFLAGQKQAPPENVPESLEIK